MVWVFIYAIIGIVLLVLLFKLIKAIIKITLYAFLIVLIIAGATVFLVARDVRHYQEEFRSSDNIYVFTQNNVSTSSLTMYGTNTSTISTLTPPALNDDSRASLHEEYYAIITVDMDDFNATNEIELITSLVKDPRNILSGMWSGAITSDPQPFIHSLKR